MALLSILLLICMSGTLTMSLCHSPFKPPMAFRSVRTSTVMLHNAAEARPMPFPAVYSQNQTGRPLRKREIILKWLDAVFHFIDGMV